MLLAGDRLTNSSDPVSVIALLRVAKGKPPAPVISNLSQLDMRDWLLLRASNPLQQSRALDGSGGGSCVGRRGVVAFDEGFARTDSEDRARRRRCEYGARALALGRIPKSGRMVATALAARDSRIVELRHAWHDLEVDVMPLGLVDHPAHVLARHPDGERRRIVGTGCDFGCSARQKLAEIELLEQRDRVGGRNPVRIGEPHDVRNDAHHADHRHVAKQLEGSGDAGLRPRLITFPVIVSSSGMTAAIWVSSPETSMMPVPSRVLTGVMNTGAWMNTLPRFAHRAMRSTVGVGAVVVWSMIQVDKGIASAIGSSTEWTEASSASDRWMRSTPLIASPASTKAYAPSDSSAFAFAASRFQTLTSLPLSSMWRTNPAPISPAPKNAILMRPSRGAPLRFRGGIACAVEHRAPSRRGLQPHGIDFVRVLIEHCEVCDPVRREAAGPVRPPRPRAWTPAISAGRLPQPARLRLGPRRPHWRSSARRRSGRRPTGEPNRRLCCRSTAGKSGPAPQMIPFQGCASDRRRLRTASPIHKIH